MGGSVASQKKERITVKYKSHNYFVFDILLPLYTAYNCSTRKQKSSYEILLFVLNQIIITANLPNDISGVPAVTSIRDVAVISGILSVDDMTINSVSQLIHFKTAAVKLHYITLREHYVWNSIIANR